ncbi:STAS domain-containing protein [Kineococcus rubinsiae]|uniref:STAS domain-containing protein n=1 Tax=Kineococcus rubinsiae TaxID=2609562 RepID=UPI0014309600|nr:STAS domain-containing protein [Kineococcus rubinsiae]NIZ90347.1 STAS domain-containing protein [Kineococcus rubinsiae]
MQPPVVGTVPIPTDEAPVLTCPVEVIGSSTLIHLRGELDVESVAVLFSAVEDQLRQGRADLQLDLGGLTFCDLSGISALQLVHQRMQAVGRRPQLLRPSALLRRVAGVCGARALFTEEP